jgi:ABC-type branched-subunit amino acid transport system substrate-binding protein
MYKGIGLTVAVAMTAVVGTGAANAADKLKIGVTATLEGTYTVLGEDGMRGYELAVQAHGGKAGGKEIETIVGATDASPDSAVRAAKKLVEQDKVDVLISPLSGSEGIAIRDYSKTQPQITVMNAASGALETTYGDPSAGITPSPTFYRTNMDGAQWQAGLGDYAYNVKGYKKIAVVGEDYSFVYTQVMGLTVEYCKAGGEITKRFWVPLGTKDFASVISSLPDDVDAIYLGLGGADAVNFLNQYQQAGGHAHLLGGSIMVDQTVLSSKGKAKEALIGTVAASGMADNDPNPKWQEFVKAYQAHAKTGYFKNAFASPSLLAINYYNSADSVFKVLDEIKGDLSDGNKKFREGLNKIVLDAPNGKITLDENRQAIGTNFVTEVVKDEKGDLISKVVKVIPNVQERLGFSKAAFDKFVPPGRDNPPCKKSYD